MQERRVIEEIAALAKECRSEPGGEAGLSNNRTASDAKEPGTLVTAA